jgi:hypothetical protein
VPATYPLFFFFFFFFAPSAINHADRLHHRSAFLCAVPGKNHRVLYFKVLRFLSACKHSAIHSRTGMNKMLASIVSRNFNNLMEALCSKDERALEYVQSGPVVAGFKQTPPLFNGAPPFSQGVFLRALYFEVLGGTL